MLMDLNRPAYVVEYLTDGGFGIAWFSSNEDAQLFISDMKEKGDGFEIIVFDLSPV